tara:strand:+ start:65 stop:553 length:489 start_codon:yes stop_codon:yes gene_type:complete
MKKQILTILLLAITTIGYSQRFGVGVQSSIYNPGLSAKFQMNDYNAVQLVASFLAYNYSDYSARYIRGFEEYNIGDVVTFQPYAVAMVSLQTFHYNSPIIADESGVGYGIGGGTSWKFSAVDKLEVTVELAFRGTFVDYNSIYYTYWTPLLPVFGAHYFLGN